MRLVLGGVRFALSSLCVGAFGAAGFRWFPLVCKSITSWFVSR